MRTDLAANIFEALADRLGEHPKAVNQEVADSGEHETKISGTFDVEALAEFLVPAVLGVLGFAPVTEEKNDAAV